MTPNKETVQRYMDAFDRSDFPEVLGCVTDDVEWLIPGLVHLHGKEAFEKEAKNEAFIGSPDITVTRLIEEDDVVVAEGSVTATRADGGMMDAVFCDVFEMRGGKIAKLISYLMEIGVSAPVTQTLDPSAETGLDEEAAAGAA